MVLLAIEVAADLASLDLAAGDGAAAAEEIAPGCERPSGTPRSSAGLDLGARHLAELLQARRRAASGLELLGRLGGYLVERG